MPHRAFVTTTVVTIATLDEKVAGITIPATTLTHAWTLRGGRSRAAITTATVALVTGAATATMLSAAGPVVAAITGADVIDTGSFATRCSVGTRRGVSASALVSCH